MTTSDLLTGPAPLELTGANELSSALVAMVSEFCGRLEDNGGVAVLRLGGGTSGAAWPGEVSIRLVNRWERTLRRLERLSTMTVAVAVGPCTGPALELLLTTDFRLATPDASVVLPPGGLWPGMALHRLATQIGVAATRRLLPGGTELTAARAVELGLFDDITTDPHAALAAKLAELVEVEGTEFAIRRRLLLDAPTTTFDDALGVHLAACDRALRQHHREATQ